MHVKKKSTRFICRECGFSSLKWYGKCPECGEWESLIEIKEESKEGQRKKPVSMESLRTDNLQSLKLLDKNLNRVFGNGIVKGSVILIAGQPGAGKSTLALKLIDEIDAKNILYVSGEENETQLKMRSARVSRRNDFEVLSTNLIEDVMANLEGKDLVIVDSVQTMNSDRLPGIAGSPTTVKFVMAELIEILKSRSIPAVIIGHITKDGSVAGPKTLEHIVDSIFMFDRVNDSDVRMLKSVKNRFGSTEEIALFRINEKGLCVIENMDSMDVSSSNSVGSVLSCSIQGSMPLALQVQALVTVSKFGFPQRVSTGVPLRRIQMISGVIDKYLDMKLGNMDLFVNVSSGIAVNDPMLDLAVIAAVVSSYKNKPVNLKNAFLGEVGLSGEVYGGRLLETRVNHLEHVGVENIYLPSNKLSSHLKFHVIKHIREIEQSI
ncbi:MAG: bifunctional adenosylcobinamide kinase/adenosylcobinamide-phosphate guanylyltransferase [bacterium]|nr:bifunctional adenosylcobinamide kinase/adenosylcobinamide-phosphate guanylyltransferase [bacterium]